MDLKTIIYGITAYYGIGCLVGLLCIAVGFAFGIWLHILKKNW